MSKKNRNNNATPQDQMQASDVQSNPSAQGEVAPDVKTGDPSESHQQPIVSDDDTPQDRSDEVQDDGDSVAAIEAARALSIEREAEQETMRFKMAAAKAAAHLPRGHVGVTGNRAQEMYYNAIAGYAEFATAAASLLYDCAMTNLHDSNRRAGPAVVLDDLKRQMEYITGSTASTKAQENLGVVSIGAKSEPDEVKQEIRTVE